jgi:hypothetical protein
MRAAFENIKSFQSRELHASDLAQRLSEDHISKLKLSKNKPSRFLTGILFALI